MTTKRFLSAMGFSLGCFAASTGYCASDAANPTQDPTKPREFSATTLAEVVPGKTTKKQVEALLGEPWRTVDFSEPMEGDFGPKVWEYRGIDSNGTYRVHIEFDEHDIASIIAKISDKTGEGSGRGVKPSSGSSAAAPEKP